MNILSNYVTISCKYITVLIINYLILLSFIKYIIVVNRSCNFIIMRNYLILLLFTKYIAVINNKLFNLLDMKKFDLMVHI